MGQAYYKEFLRWWLKGVGSRENPTNAEVAAAMQAHGLIGALAEFENWLIIEKGLK